MKARLLLSCVCAAVLAVPVVYAQSSNQKRTPAPGSSVQTAPRLKGAPIAPVTASRPTVLTETDRLVDRGDERVSVLSNGLHVLLKAHRTAPVVSVRMYCRTGSIYEQEYLGSGMSHLFEHLLHGSATTTRSEEDSRKILDDIGGNTNAYTSYDVTCYFVDTGKEHLATAVDLLGDWITHPTFPEDAFQREWGVVQRELERDKDDPQRQMFQITMETMYPGHPARFPVIGYQPVVQKLKKEDIVGYYHRMYVPDNIIVCIVGDIDLDAALGVVEAKFANFTRQRVPTIVLPETAAVESQRLAIKRMKVQAAMLTLAWPSIPLTDPDLYALDLLSYILTQGESSRLVTSIRDTGLVYAIDSSSWTPEWARGIFTVGARLSPEKLDAAKAEILLQIGKLQADLVSADELQQAKQQKAAEHVFSMQTAESVAESMANDFRSTGDTHFSELYVENIQKVTAEQVREVARKYLQTKRLGTIAIMPEDYQPASEKMGATAAPEPVRVVTLENGLRCLIRRDPTSPLVAMQAFSVGGVLMEDDKTNGLSRLAAVLAPRGTQKRSAEEISRFFDSRGADFEGTSANNSIYFKAQVLKKDFVAALDVFADVVSNPTFPAEELDRFRPQLLDQINRIDETWRTELFAYLQRHFFVDSPYRFQSVGTRDVVAKATRDQVAEFYHRLATGPNTVVAIYGDVDPKEAEKLVRDRFGSLPKETVKVPEVAARKVETPKLYIKPKPPTRDVAGIALAFPGMTVASADVPAMAVLDTIVSGYRYPTGWLHESLRGGRNSLVYEVHAQNIAGLIPGDFIIYAACQPDKVNEVYKIITAQLDKARAGKFEAGELEQAKTIIKTTELMENQTNAERAMQSSLDELYGLGHDYRAKYLEQVAGVTLEQVTATAKKYFTVPTVVVVTPTPDQVDIGIAPEIDKGSEAASAGEKQPAGEKE
jgi:zinc protease